MHARAGDLDGFLIEIDDGSPVAINGLGMAFRAPHDGLDARDEFVLVERFRQIITAPNPKP